MQDLTPVGLSRDGRRLLLVGPTGEEFAVPVDTLRAALRGDHARLGQLEKKMESALRPRDIQARIRAGESPEDVAAAAGTGVDAIMGFAGPVIAERQHVAQTALKASVRRRSGESSSAGRTLGEAAELFFSDHSLHDEDVEWDAWRRPDGRWALVAAYDVAGRPRTAEFTHDLPGRYVIAENDEARILTGELREPESREPAGGRPSVRRLSSVGLEDELPLGDDAIELVRDREPEADEPTELADFAPHPVAAADPVAPVEPAAADLAADSPVDAGLDPRLDSRLDPGADTADADWIATEPLTHDQRDAGPGTRPGDEPDDRADQGDQGDQGDQPMFEVEGGTSDAGPGADLPGKPAAGAPTPPKKKSRSSVPSWDEIMFGGKNE